MNTGSVHVEHLMHRAVIVRRPADGPSVDRPACVEPPFTLSDLTLLHDEAL